MDIPPAQIVGVVRLLVGFGVIVGLACLETVYNPPLGHPLPLHALAQTGAGALIAAFFAAVGVAALGAVTDIDAPSRYRAQRR